MKEYSGPPAPFSAVSSILNAGTSFRDVSQTGSCLHQNHSPSHAKSYEHFWICFRRRKLSGGLLKGKTTYVFVHVSVYVRVCA